MKPNRIMCIIPAGIVAGIFMFSSCHSGYSMASVEGSRIEVTAALDANPDSAAIAVLAPYQKTVDSIMSPVIGQSARFMDRFRPESELSPSGKAVRSPPIFVTPTSAIRPIYAEAE